MFELDNYKKKILDNTLLRNTRNRLLADSDKYMLPDFPISDTDRETLRVYREKLRNATDVGVLPSRPECIK